jgi:hypothetical protein
VYAHLNNDNNASYDFGINAAGVNSCGTTAAPPFRASSSVCVTPSNSDFV